jgi:hypothetical protein
MEPEGSLRRSQWPRGLRHELSSLARTLGSWVRIPPQAWMSVCVYSVCVVLCVNSGLATGWTPDKGAQPFIRLQNLKKKRPGLNKGLWSHWWINVHYCVRKSPSMVLVRWIKPTYCHIISLRFTLIVFSHLCLGLLIDLFPSGFLIKILHALLSSPMYATCHAPSHPPWTDRSNIIWSTVTRTVYLLVLIFGLLSDKFNTSGYTARNDCMLGDQSVMNWWGYGSTGYPVREPLLNPVSKANHVTSSCKIHLKLN